MDENLPPSLRGMPASDLPPSLRGLPPDELPPSLRGGATTMPGAIPGQEGEEARRVTAQAANPPPSIGQKVRGALETALEVVAQVTGGGLGMVGGALGGLAGSVATGQFGTRQGAQGVEQAAVEGGERGATAARGALQSMLGMDEGAAPSPTGQEMIEATGQVMQQVPALTATPLGTLGMGAKGPGGMRPALDAAGTAARAGADAATAAVTPTMAPAKAALASKAVGADIPLNLHQLSGNKFVRMVGEWAENIPLSGSKKQQRQQAFNAGLAKAIDPDLQVTSLTPEVFDTAMTKAGEAIGEISGRTPVPHDSLTSLVEVARRDTPDVQAVVKTYADDLAKVAEENGGIVPGETFRKIRSEASRQSRTTPNGDLRRTLGDLVKRMDDALAEHAAEGDMPALLDARRRYAIGSTLMPLVAKSADGNISPAGLMGAVTRDNAGKNRMARARGGDLGDYARIGQEFLKEQPSSGTAERNLVYRAATDAAKASKVALAWPAAVVYNLVGPKIAKRMVTAAERRAAPLPEGPPPELTTAPGAAPPRGPTPAPEAGPLGDVAPEWDTQPGAAPETALEVVPAEGLVPALGEAPLTRVQPAGAAPEATGAALRGAGEQIPAVPGRPDLPDTMTVGVPAEAAASDAANAAMVTPGATLSRTGTRVQSSGNPALAEVDRLRSQTQSPEVQKVLDEHAKKIEAAAAEKVAEAKRKADAAELRAMADKTIDPELAAALRKKADKIEKPEPVPAGETKELAATPTKPVVQPKKLPVGEATEIAPEVITPENPDIPVGEATEITPDVVEVGNAPGQVPEQGRVQQERVQGNEVRPPAEAGAGDRIQREAQGGSKAQEGVAGKTFAETYEALSSEQKAARKQMVSDMIATKKENQQDHTALTERLATMDAIDRGVSLDGDPVVSSVVLGHPMFDGAPAARNLIPMKVASVADAEHSINRADTFYRGIAKAYHEADHAIKSAKTAVQRAAAKKKMDVLRNQGIDADLLADIREQTLPELQRIYKAAVKRFGESNAKRLESDAVQPKDGEEGVQARTGAGGKEAQGKAQEGKVKFEAGKVYVDAKGKKAVYQADGTWKEVD